MKIISYVFQQVPSLIKLQPEKKVQSSGQWLECLGVPSAQIVLAGSLIKLQPEKKGTVVWPSVAMSDCFGGFVAMFFGRFLNQITNYNRKKGTVVWLAYTICNTRNVLFLLCLYLKRGNELNVGIVWFEGKAPSQTSKTCLTMVEPFAGPSSMAISNQPMPLRYPLCKRLSKGGVRGFLLTL
jgi:hypothetical protein